MHPSKHDHCVAHVVHGACGDTHAHGACKIGVAPMTMRNGPPKGMPPLPHWWSRPASQYSYSWVGGAILVAILVAIVGALALPFPAAPRPLRATPPWCPSASLA